MQDDVYQTMFEIEDRHWWYAAKQRIVLNLLHRYLPPRSNGTKPHVADLGCGCGAMLARMKDRFDAVLETMELLSNREFVDTLRAYEAGETRWVSLADLPG